MDVYPLNPLLHNSPQRIAGEVEALVVELRSRYDHVVAGYADCGTYGALDEVCARLGVPRLPGLHCYDLYAGPRTIEDIMTAEPGTYLLTDFLVRSFHRTVIRELGLDRWPELREDYFRHYRQVLWLAQASDPVELAELRTLAQEAAAQIGLPMVVRPTGFGGLEQALVRLVEATQ